MASPAIPPSTVALQKSYVTYTAPIYNRSIHEASVVTTLESRALLSSSGSTGLRTWDAALHLGAYLASHTGKACVHGKNILELGAGTGFLSIFCAKHAGAIHVLATDGDGDAVDDIGANIYLNGLEDSGRIETIVLKWGHALIDELLSGQDEGRMYDVVLGADVVCMHHVLTLLRPASFLFVGKALIESDLLRLSMLGNGLQIVLMILVRFLVLPVSFALA